MLLVGAKARRDCFDCSEGDVRVVNARGAVSRVAFLLRPSAAEAVLRLFLKVYRRVGSRQEFPAVRAQCRGEGPQVASTHGDGLVSVSSNPNPSPNPNPGPCLD